MKNFSLLLLLLIMVGCGAKESVKNNKRTVQGRAVAVKVDGNSTILSSGRLDDWYRIDIPLDEGMVYEVTLEIPRVVKDPLFIPANLLDMRPLDFLQRDLYGRYITKYRELKSAEREYLADPVGEN